MRLSTAVVGLLLLGLPVLASSAELRNLFQIDVIAESASTLDRDQAIRRALAKVLYRISTAPDPMDDPVMQTAVDNALFYARQYQFALMEIPGFPASARRLRVVFDDRRLLELLKSSRFGIWNEMRPETLLWLVLEEESGQQVFFSNAQKPLLAGAIADASENQGLPLVFPLMDLAERQNLTPRDLLSAYPERVLAASGRYDVVSILVGRLVKREDCWDSEWSHYFDHQVRQWRHGCEPMNRNLASGLRGAYLRLAEFYGVKPEVSQPGSTVINISGIAGETDAKTALNRLQNLPGVKSVSWLSVDAQFHRYRLDYDGDAFTLRQLFDGSGYFQALPSSAGQEWYYRFSR